MRAGVHEVLHSPPDAAEISAALRRAAHRRQVARHGAGRGRMIAFIACKGGSGATLVATNVAYLLATERELEVALIDLDLEYGDATAFLTDQRAKGSVADIARHVERLDAKLLKSSMVAVTPRLHVLPAPDDPEAALAVTGAQIERLLDVARDAFDVVILDLGRMFDGVAVKALDKADIICPVTEDLVPCIRDAKRLMRSFNALGYAEDKIQLVVNRYERSSRIPLAELEAAVGAKVKHTIPSSFEQVAEAINLGVPLVKLAPHNAVVKALRELGTKLVGPAPSRGWIERLVSQAH
jgi:pilus assembly protein CpaE